MPDDHDGRDAVTDAAASTAEANSTATDGSTEASDRSGATMSGGRADGGLAPGQLLDGRLEIERRLGAGAMGEVYLARDRRLDRHVAIKLHVRTTGLERLRREAIALAQIRHPNVVAVHGVGQVDGRLFLAMDYVRGATLREWLAAAPRSGGAILDVVVAAGRGLAAIHAAGLVHRDVKPDNVLVDGDGRAYMADLGLASELGEAGAEASPPASALSAPATSSPSSGIPDELLGGSITTTGARVGTPAYMGPEQLAGAEVDARADQFAFCVMAWEALCGRRPHAGRNAAELLEATSREQIEPPPASPLSRGLQATLRRGLAADPARRWPSLPALLDAMAADRPRARRRRRLALAAAAAIGLGTAAIAATRLAASPPAIDCAIAGDSGNVWRLWRRAAVAVGLARSGHAASNEIWSRLAPRLSGYAAELRRSATAVCRATASAALPAPLDARAVACLDRSRNSFDELLRQLESADIATASRALNAAGSLPDLRACVSAGALAAELAPPDPSMARAVEALRGRLDRISVMSETGHSPEARAALAEVSAEAGRLDYPPLSAYLALIQGELVRNDGDHVAAIEQLERAYFLARTARDHRTARLAAEQLVSLHDGRATLDQARLWLRHLQAAAQADHFDAGVQSRLATLAGGIAITGGDPDEGLALLAQAWIASRLVSSEVGGLLHNEIARALNDLGRYREARPHYDAALAYFDREVGPGSAHYVDTLSQAAYAATMSGDPQGAVTLAERAVALSGQWPELGGRRRAELLVRLAITLQQSGDRVRAIAVYNDARTAAVALGSQAELLVANVDSNLATVEGELQRNADAERHHRSALEIRQRLLPAGHLLIGTSLANVGTFLASVNRCAEAIPFLEKGIAQIARNAPDHLGQAIALIELGICRAHANERARGIRDLERAIALREAAGLGPQQVGYARYMLAAVLSEVGATRPAARAQMEQALLLLRREPRGMEPVIAAIEAWLADPGDL